MAEINEFVQALSAMSVMEIVELTKALEDHWGVKAAAAMPMMMGAMPTRNAESFARRRSGSIR